MKKLYALFLSLFLTPAFALVTGNIPNGCISTRTTANAYFAIDQYTCSSGYFLPADGESCVSCSTGATCNGGTFYYNATTSQGIIYNKTFTTNQSNSCLGDIGNPRAIFSINDYVCNSGYFLPANGVACASCPNGATCVGGRYMFRQDITQGIIMPNLITQNMINTCNNDLIHSNNNTSNIRAVFQIDSFVCNAGYYLPANAIACTQCPANSYCPGGTYSFNETTTQGITACPDNKTSPAGSDAESDCAYVSMCATGEYLPMNTTTCTICPANSYCIGGTYIFNETTAQGITACSAGTYSPAGAGESAQCGRILHIGDDIMYLRSDKITSPALHIDVDHDGVADFFGNMTTADVVMHAGSERKFKVKYGDTIYSVYDDTVTLPAE